MASMASRAMLVYQITWQRIWKFRTWAHENHENSVAFGLQTQFSTYPKISKVDFYRINYPHIFCLCHRMGLRETLQKKLQSWGGLESWSSSPSAPAVRMAHRPGIARPRRSFFGLAFWCNSQEIRGCVLYQYVSYMVVDQNSFIRERPFFANKIVTFAKLSRTPCLSFVEPMLGNHDIQLSRNFCEKNVTFANSKKTFARVSNITCTAFAIKTPYKDL